MEVIMNCNDASKLIDAMRSFVSLVAQIVLLLIFSIAFFAVKTVPEGLKG